MTKANLVKAYQAVVLLLKKYPAAEGAILNVAVLLAAKFGFHVTTTELVAIGGAIAVIVGVYTHVTVTPNVKVALRQDPHVRPVSGNPHTP
jgi:hypothetical protein